MNAFLHMFSELECPSVVADETVLVTHEPTEYTMGSFYEFQCSETFRQSGGNSSITCSGEGTWIGQVPTCTSMFFWYLTLVEYIEQPVHTYICT